MCFSCRILSSCGYSGFLSKQETHFAGPGRAREPGEASFPFQCLENGLTHWFLVLTFLQIHMHRQFPLPRLPGSPGCLPPTTSLVPLLWPVESQSRISCTFFCFWLPVIAFLVLSSSMVNSWNRPSIKCHRQKLSWGWGSIQALRSLEESLGAGVCSEDT